MQPSISHIVEPDRLLLCWQARESESRSRYVVGELVKHHNEVHLDYLEGQADFEKAREHGFVGYPAFPLQSGLKHTNLVLEAFTRRLPPRNRRDFSRYLQLRAIPPTAAISDFALLGYTGAKLPNDGFELVHTFARVSGDFELVVEVAGFRHESTIPADHVDIGEPVTFVPEPDNRYDTQAVKILLRGRKIGYLDRGHLGLFHKLIGEGAVIEGEVFRKNGTPERPLIYIFTRVRFPSHSGLSTARSTIHADT